MDPITDLIAVGHRLSRRSLKLFVFQIALVIWCAYWATAGAGHVTGWIQTALFAVNAWGAFQSLRTIEGYLDVIDHLQRRRADGWTVA